MPRFYSLAALELMGAGVRLDDVASRAGVTRATVSRWLNGHYRPRDELFAVLADIAGPTVAERVRELIPEPSPPEPPPRCGAPIMGGRTTCERLAPGGRCFSHRDVAVSS